MKIIFVTYGSRGDVQPLLALALALKTNGHQVLLCAPPDNAEWIKSYSCPFHAFGSDYKELVETFDSSNKRTIKDLNFLILFNRREIGIQFSQLPSIIKDTDLVLASGVAYGVPAVAELLGIPYRFIILSTGYIPSSHYPFWGVSNQNLPRWLNRLSWWLGNKFTNIFFKKIINRERSRLGLKPTRDVWNYMLGGHVFVATDPILGSVPSDVKQDYIQFGYLHLHQKGNLSTNLEAFLATGAPPVYVGFGSMVDKNPEASTRLVIEAVRAAGQRVIISSGWAHLGGVQTEKDCYFVGDVPHMLLFPRVTAVVHHGGSGTTATAARAGVPQIIVPHSLDQFYWAKQIYSKGLGPKPIPRTRLTAKRLSVAIQNCVSNKRMRGNAQEVARIIQDQNSLDKAVRYIESEFVSKTNNSISSGFLS